MEFCGHGTLWNRSLRCRIVGCNPLGANGEHRKPWLQRRIYSCVLFDETQHGVSPLPEWTHLQYHWGNNSGFWIPGISHHRDTIKSIGCSRDLGCYGNDSLIDGRDFHNIKLGQNTTDRLAKAIELMSLENSGAIPSKTVYASKLEICKTTAGKSSDSRSSI